MAKIDFFQTSQFFEIFRRLNKSALVRPFSNLFISSPISMPDDVKLCSDVIGGEMGLRQCRLVD